MKVVVISDLHGHLPENIIECDVVCICGDVSPLRIQSRTHDMRKWLNGEFIPWVACLPCKKVILVAGNHDFFFQRHPGWQNNINTTNSKLVILEDSSTSVDGITFYGTPWCPDLANWAFYGTSEELTSKFSLIPKNIDILLTHCPPRISTFGVVLQDNVFNSGTNYGCIELAKAIIESKPKYCFSGHVHSGNHLLETYNDTTIANVSMKDEHYEVKYKPLEIEI